jgi:hypothetical protein
MSKPGNDITEAPAEKTAPTGKGIALSAIQIIAGGGAAAVASVIGGHLGLAGTVVGAFILSVISAIALPLFRTSLEKSHEQIMRVLPRRGAEAGRIALPQVPTVTAKGRKIGIAVGGTAIMFLIGVGSILGIQSATGMALSSGTSALQTGVSHVVSSVKDTSVTPVTYPTPGAPTVVPSTVPTDSATPTDTATEPAQQPTPAPTETGDTAPSVEPTAPADAETPAPASTPDPAVGTSDTGSGAGGTGSQSQPSAGTSDGGAAAPAK